MTIANRSSAQFFEAKYRQHADPWNFASNSYEQHRYDTIISALGSHRYGHAFEPGCSIGVLTERLARICDSILAIDFSQIAVESAQKRCAYLSNVEIRCASIHEISDVEEADLVVLSEVGYYLDSKDWRATADRLLTTMRRDAVVLAAHWLGNSADHSISGDEVHEVLTASALLHLEYSERNEAFRLDRWVRV